MVVSSFDPPLHFRYRARARLLIEVPLAELNQASVSSIWKASDAARVPTVRRQKDGLYIIYSI